MYRPKDPFTVPVLLLPVVKRENIKGTTKKIFLDPAEASDDMQLFVSLRTYGGTETIVNGVITISDTAVVETWYRPDIKADCRIYVCETQRTYDIISPPEDIDMRHQFVKFKIRSVGGKP